MGVDHVGAGGLYQEIQKLWRELQRVAKATLQNGSIGRAGLRVYDGGWIRIEGGGLSVTGTQTVSGRLEGDGVLDWSGTVYFRGPTGVQGEFAVSGPTTLSGNVTGTGVLDWLGTVYLKGPTGVQGNFAVSGESNFTGDVELNSDLTVGTGRIIVGPMVLDKGGSYGGRLHSTGTLLLSATGNVVAGAPFQALNGISSVGNITAVGNLSVTGDVGGLTKSFWIDHPSKPGKQLRHGSLEGPEHGVYYRGVVEFDADGEAVFELPDYFTDLVLPEDVPTVQVTAVGRPFMTGAEPVEDGRVIVYGEADREAHVTVTAARGLFDVEPDKEATGLP